MNTTNVDIIVATFRRPAMLRDTVLSLRTMEMSADVALKVLVIDNDPECSARPVIEDLVESCADNCVLRYISEPRVGLSHARNRGIEEAHGEVIGFLDDDVFISKQWLVAMLGCLDRTGAAAVGGRIENCWEDEPDPTVRACQYQLITPNWGDDDFKFGGRSTPGGGNAIFRRAVFDCGLRFSPELGRIGNLLLSGEDSNLFRRLQNRGDAVWYCAAAVMHHRIAGERLTQGYLIRRSFWFGYSYSLIDRRVDGRLAQFVQAVSRFGKLLLVDAPRLAWSMLRRDAKGKLIARCSLAKQWGYFRATWYRVSMTTAPSQPPPSSIPCVQPEPLETSHATSR